MRIPRPWRTFTAVAATALILSGCGGDTDSGGGDDAETLRIGVVLSLTGPAAPFGIPEKEAVEVIVDDINEGGGVNGRQIELFVADDQTDPTEAARLVRGLVLDDEVHVILGATVGSATLAAAPIAAANNVPMVAPNGTIAITDPDNDFADWVFRSSVNDAILVDKGIAAAADDGATTLGLFYQEDAYGESSKERAEEFVAEDGRIEIVSSAPAAASATDVVAQATRIVNADPDAILVQASSPALGAAFARALGQVRYEGRVIVAGGLTTDAFIDAAAGTAEGIESVGGIGWDTPTEGQQAVIDALEAGGYGPPTGFGEAIGLAALNAIVTAVEQVDGDLTGEAIRDALWTTCFDPLIHGPEACYGPDDHDAMTIEHGAVVRVVDGAWVSVE